MRVNIYSEELTDRVEIVTKIVDGKEFFGLRFYLELPATLNDIDGKPQQICGPFIHRAGDDDSAAVTFWSNSHGALHELFNNAITAITADDDE